MYLFSFTCFSCWSSASAATFLPCFCCPSALAVLVDTCSFLCSFCTLLCSFVSLWLILEVYVLDFVILFFLSCLFCWSCSSFFLFLLPPGSAVATTSFVWLPCTSAAVAPASAPSYNFSVVSSGKLTLQTMSWNFLSCSRESIRAVVCCTTEFFMFSFNSSSCSLHWCPALVFIPGICFVSSSTYFNISSILPNISYDPVLVPVTDSLLPLVLTCALSWRLVGGGSSLVVCWCSCCCAGIICIEYEGVAVLA